MQGRVRRSGARGFTLVELLAVVAIIVLLTAIVVPNVTRARTRAAVTTTEANLDNLKTALESYRRAFGTYPGDVFPSEDVNNDGVLDTAEDIGVDVDGDGTTDYALTANGRIDAGDGVINIDDLEWALRTTARGGPFIDDFPVDGWGQRFVYSAPMTRSVSNQDFLYLNPEGAGNNIRSEDLNRNGLLDPDPDGGGPLLAEDIGIAAYATVNADVDGAFVGKRAGANNNIIDHGDDDNKDGLITFSIDDFAPPGQPTVAVVDQWELGNLDISPDGLARSRGFYLYSVGIDGVDNSVSGYEDLTGNNLSNDGTIAPLLTASPPLGTRAGGGPATLTNPPTIVANSEDQNASTDLDTGLEDTGVDGRANTKDTGEGDALLTAGEQFQNFDGFRADGTVDATVVDNYHPTETVGQAFTLIDDINSWNDDRPWRQHPDYN